MDPLGGAKLHDFANLGSKQQRLISGDCLACLAYFAIVTARCKRSEVIDALSRATAPTANNTYDGLRNWWDSKLRNLQWAFAEAGLHGATLYHYTIATPTSKGREGQLGTQRRIRQYAITYFLTSPSLCATLARTCFRAGATLPPHLSSVLFAWIDSSSVSAHTLSAEEACTPEHYSDVPGSSDDSREYALRGIRLRRGQQAFRESLRVRYGDRCVVTQCDVLDVLEAAHIKPYRGDSDHHPDNGLLLRADIHTLFDVHLLSVDPQTWHVWTHPKVRTTYADLHELPLQVPPRLRPSSSYVAEHFAVAQQRI